MSKKKPTIRGGAGRQKYDFQTTKPSQTKPNQIDQTNSNQTTKFKKKLNIRERVCRRNLIFKSCAKKMYPANIRNMPSAKVMYLGAMWRWGRVGDILADVLSYRSCLTSRERERGRGGTHATQRYSTQLKPNQTN